MRMFKKDLKAVSPVIAIILMVAITVVLASVLYVWVNTFLDPPNDPIEFPTIEMSLKDGGSNDVLTIKHTTGIPVEWSKHKIIITNNTDESQISMDKLNALGYQSFGETVSINSTIPGFTDMDFEKGKTYRVEIYNIDQGQRVYDNTNVICV